jgi:hypothetical protein
MTPNIVVTGLLFFDSYIGCPLDLHHAPLFDFFLVHATSFPSSRLFPSRTNLKIHSSRDSDSSNTRLE